MSREAKSRLAGEKRVAPVALGGEVLQKECLPAGLNPARERKEPRVPKALCHHVKGEAAHASQPAVVGAEECNQQR